MKLLILVLICLGSVAVAQSLDQKFAVTKAKCDSSAWSAHICQLELRRLHRQANPAQKAQIAAYMKSKRK